MNPETPQTPREKLEARLTALLMGELQPEGAAAIRALMAADPELSALHERLRKALELLREASALPEQPAPPAPVQLSSDRREKLLAHFKTAAPAPASPPTPAPIVAMPRRNWTWIIPAGIAAAVIALLGAGLLLPSFTSVEGRNSARISPAFSYSVDASVDSFPNEASFSLQPGKNGGNYLRKSPSSGTSYIPGYDDLELRSSTLETPASSAGLAGAQITQNEFQRSQPSGDGVFVTSSIADRGALSGSGVVVTGANIPTNGSYVGGTFQSPGSDQFGAFQKEATEADQKRPFLYDLNGQASIVLNGFTSYSGATTITGGGTTSSDRSSNVILGSGGDTATPTGSSTLTIHAGPVSFQARPGVKDGTFTTSDADLGVTMPSSIARGTIALRAASGSDLFDTGIGGTIETTAQPARLSTASSNGMFSLASNGALSVAGPGTPNNITIEGDAVRIFPGSRSPSVARSGNVTFGTSAVDNSNIASKTTGSGKQDNSSAEDAVSTLGEKIVDSVAPPAVRTRTIVARRQIQKIYTGAPPKIPEALLAERGGDDRDGIPNERPWSIASAPSVPKTTPYIPPDSPAGVPPVPPASDAAAKDMPMAKLEKKDAAKAIPRQPPTPSAPSQPEVLTRDNAFSTFSLNVSDVSFKLAAASLEQGRFPDPSIIRSEEFVNAFDYRDPEPAPGAPLAFASERARYPFAQNRDLLRFSVKTAAAGRQPGRPLNIVLLLDKSGSMERADRVNIVREALRVLAAQLQPQDKLSIVTFARTPRLWADGVAGDKAGAMIKRVSEITPEGGTNLEAALDLGYQTALRHYTVGGISRVVLFTDGAANLGDVDPAALTRKVEAHRKKGVALDCFGIGWEGYNDDLLEQLTRNGDGRYGFINTPEEAAANFATQLAGALQVAASDVKTQVEFNPRRVIAYRQIGYAKHQLTKEQFRDNTVNAAQIGAAESGNALYVVQVDPRGEGDLATVRVRFRVPGTADYREHEWAVPFDGNAQPLEQSTPALRLAGTAAAFSEMLAASPYAAEVTTDRLLGLLNGVPAIYGADPRPKKLEWMIRQVKNLSGH